MPTCKICGDNFDPYDFRVTRGGEPKRRRSPGRAYCSMECEEAVKRTSAAARVAVDSAEILRVYAEGGVQAMCSEWAISRPTAYRWLARARE